MNLETSIQQQISGVEEEILRKHPNWTQEKAMWIAERIVKAW